MATLTHPKTTGRRARRPVQAPAPSGTEFQREYWLSHCEGYRIDAVEGRLGFVEEVRGGDTGAPTLVVRAGRFGRRLLLVSTDEVAFVVPRAKRIWLRSPVTIAGTEPAAQLARVGT